jgi:hypothetical protein
MIKKTLLFVLALSVAMVAPSAVSSASEIHTEGVKNFAGPSGAATLASEGEPTITCASGGIEGTVEAGGTTGTIIFDFRECHTFVFGFTAKCHTPGSFQDTTIKTSGTYHFIAGPKILVTPATTTIICAGISNTVVHGNLIGTVTKPGCGPETKEMTTAFSATGTIQNHLEYTGVKYDLTTTTGESGAAKTAGLTFSATTNAETLGRLNCTI